MDRRQTLLIALLLVVFCGYAADQGYRRLYEQPLAKAQQRVEALGEELHAGTLEIKRQQKRLPELDRLAARSLPRNTELALTEYRSWLLKAIEDSQLEQSNLDSGTPARFRDLYTRIEFTLRTQGPLSDVTRLLHTFYNADYLHKIRSLSLTPTSDGSLDVSMTIEALVVPSLADDRLLANAQPPIAGPDPLQDYQIVARRNLFRPGEPPAASIKLSAITSDADQQRRAWLRFLRTGETRILSEGDAVTLDGSSLRVARILPETVVFEIDGDTRDVQIGHTLAE